MLFGIESERYFKSYIVSNPTRQHHNVLYEVSHDISKVLQKLVSNNFIKRIFPFPAGPASGNVWKTVMTIWISTHKTVLNKNLTRITLKFVYYDQSLKRIRGEELLSAF